MNDRSSNDRLFRKATRENLLGPSERSVGAVTDATAALEARERTRPSGRGQLGYSVLLVAVLALVAEALGSAFGFRFFGNLADRIGTGVVVFLLASIVLAAIVLDQRKKGRSINEQSLGQTSDETRLTARISPLLLWAAILFDLFGLLLLLDGAVVAGVILFVPSSVFLSLWLRLRPRRQALEEEDVSDD